MDPHSFYADPDPAVFLNADPDPGGKMNADPDPQPCSQEYYSGHFNTFLYLEERGGTTHAQ